MSESEEKPLTRTAKRRAGKAVEELAKKIANLSDGLYGYLHIPGVLKEEIEIARSTKGHSSRKRQIKYLAGVFRRHEEAFLELVKVLDGLDQVQHIQNAKFHDLEQMRDRLCDPEQFEQALVDLKQSGISLDTAALTRLAVAVHNGGDKRAFREIFRRLKNARLGVD